MEPMRLCAISWSEGFVIEKAKEAAMASLSLMKRPQD